MRTKLLTTFALLLMAVSGVWAQTSGECGDGVTWAYDAGTLTHALSSVRSTFGRFHSVAEKERARMKFKVVIK